MSHRHLLPLSRITEFSKHLVDEDWEIQDAKGDYEALRATKPKQPTIVIFWRVQKGHGGGPRGQKPYCTVRHGCPSIPILRKWLNKNPNPIEISRKATDSRTEPDWTGKCENCDQSPVVTATGLCGPCTFGEAETAGGNW